VCEMVAEKGVAKGGDYEAQLKYCTIQESLFL
jgi:hypothetical protein